MPQVLIYIYIYIYDLRQSSNAETQNEIIKNMIRPTQLKDESLSSFHQRSKPTEVKHESFSYFHQRSKPTEFKNETFETFRQDTTQTQVVNISDEMGTTAPADTDIDEQVARAKPLADYELRQAEIRHQQMIEGVRQEAVTALLQQEQTHTQQKAQDHGKAAATIQRIEHQAQGFIYEAQGAMQR